LKTFADLIGQHQPSGYKYNHYSLVREHGQYFKPQDRPSWVKKGKDKDCYKNASLFVVEHPEYTYVEGFADPGITETSFPVNHAWAVDKDGNVIE